jgi:hypothetical protein
MSDDALLGSSMTLVIDGQEVTGTVTGVSASQLEVTVNIRQPARGYAGTQARVVMGEGDEVLLDLGKHSFYTSMVVVVPTHGKRRPAAPLRVRPTDSDADSASEESDGEETANTALKPSERRRFFRLGIELDVEVLENVGARKEYVRARGRTLNLSGGGMLLNLDKILLAGVHHFRVHLPKEEMILLGRVIRNEKGLSSTTPVEFIDLHEADRSKLIRYIFKAMRNGREEDEQPKTDEPPRYWQRRQKFFTPQKPRYW